MGNVLAMPQLNGVQAIRQLDEHHTNVVHHGQDHLANVFGLARFRSQKIQPVDFRDPFDKESDLRPEAFGDALRGYARILHNIVQ